MHLIGDHGDDQDEVTQNGRLLKNSKGADNEARRILPPIEIYCRGEVLAWLSAGAR